MEKLVFKNFYSKLLCFSFVQYMMLQQKKAFYKYF